MFKLDTKSDLSQISLTGARSLVILGLLIQEPRSLEEIREAFIKYSLMEESNSDDILRIDLNTLRAMGCEISRSCKKTGFKHVLLKHPFSLKIEKDEMDVISRALKKIKGNLDVNKMLEYDLLLKKISERVSDSETKEALLGFRFLKSYNLEFLSELKSICKNRETVNLIYKSPVSKEKSEKEIAAEELVFKNNKIYLYGFDKDLKEAVTLNIKRIISILSRKEDGSFETKKVTIKFLLKEFGVMGLDKNEKILECTNDGYIIEGQYFNNFLALQRIMSFGPLCKVIEPEDFKQQLVETIKRVKEIYNG